MPESTKKKPSWPTLLLLEASTLGAGGLVGFLTTHQNDFYETLARPAFAPPAWLFPVAWTALYSAMAAAMWLVLRKRGQERFILLGLYIAQLAVNLLWPVIFFVQHALGLAFFWLVLLIALVGIMMERFFRESKLAGGLIVPYFLWNLFAGALNFALARMNP